MFGTECSSYLHEPRKKNPDPKFERRLRFVLARMVVPGQVLSADMVKQSEADPAGVFACANSLWRACQKAAIDNPGLDLSEAYNGYDQLMREVMRVGEVFEQWACVNVEFDRFAEVWPYLLEMRFGDVCVSLFGADGLANFSEADCLVVAWTLELPLEIEAEARSLIGLEI